MASGAKQAIQTICGEAENHRNGKAGHVRRMTRAGNCGPDRYHEPWNCSAAHQESQECGGCHEPDDAAILGADGGKPHNRQQDWRPAYVENIQMRDGSVPGVSGA